MATILDTIAEYAKIRVNNAKKEISLEEMKEKAFGVTNKTPFAFENALKNDRISFICECKKASPSKGVIANDFPYLDIAKEYEIAGADCISVLTEPKWFMGKNEYLTDIQNDVSIPCLRKDFTIDEYMIYEAKAIGADAVLLICSLLSGDKIAKYIEICDELGISAVVEAHDEDEIKSGVDAGARIIGVNNRNLKDFSVDVTNSARLRELVPDDITFIAESGIKTHDDIVKLEGYNVNAVLIGETLMKADDKRAMLNELRDGK